MRMLSLMGGDFRKPGIKKSKKKAEMHFEWCCVRGSGCSMINIQCFSFITVCGKLIICIGLCRDLRVVVIKV